jgi:hypothetical protein
MLLFSITYWLFERANISDASCNLFPTCLRAWRSLIYGCRLDDLQSRGLGYVTAELRAELRDVIGEEGSFVASARDGHVTEARVEQIRVNPSVDINQDALCGQSLGTVTGNGITVIEMAMLTAAGRSPLSIHSTDRIHR